MKVDLRTLHVVAYAKRPGGEREVVGHGALEPGHKVSLHSESAVAWDIPLSSRLTRGGRVRVEHELGTGVVGTLSVGKPLRVTKRGGVELRIEARQLVGKPGKVLTPKSISPLALRAFEVELQRQEVRQGAKVTRDGWLAALDERVSAFENQARELESLFAGTPGLTAVKAFFAERRATIAALQERTAARFDAVIHGKGVRREQVERLSNVDEMARAKLDTICTLGDAASLRRSVRKLRRLADRVPAVRSLPAPFKPLHAAALAELEAAWIAVVGVLDGKVFDTLSAADAVEKLAHPGMHIRGTATVTAERRHGQLTHWTVRFDNTGNQAFVGTVVFPRGDKNDGIGFESMGLPGKGAAAEQLIVPNGHYGQRAQAGMVVRLGVRSYGWTEVQLPRSGSVSVDIAELTVEDDGIDRSEDFLERDVRRKRAEKYFTGKVRFFEGGRPWAPRRQGDQ